MGVKITYSYTCDAIGCKKTADNLAGWIAISKVFVPSYRRHAIKMLRLEGTPKTTKLTMLACSKKCALQIGGKELE